ncbi:MAG TPA: DUF1800 domain-containing protein [Methylomirabilota bacterium]|nr:DUF1800 domain-containing protein [Methylomirabilota bacterium]
MRRWRIGLVVVAVGLLLAGCGVAHERSARSVVPDTPVGLPVGSRLTLPLTTLDPDRQVLHVLSRLAYGPRPGDVERVRAMGLAAWIERQLEPERIPDELVERRLGAYPTLRMTTAELFQEFPRPDPAASTRRREAMLSGEAPMRDAMAGEAGLGGPPRIATELAAARLERAVWSERQLEEVLVDFWFNHFNVFAGKDAVRWMVSAYEREAIRPHALGRFRDLVLATARHPAMLFYLDNWMSVRDGLIVPSGPNQGQRRGLNENYARELLELHTLGVDGGYTQADIVETARAFTGWSIDYQGTRQFLYRPGAHDDGEKRVLGHALPAGGGEGDGLAVIDIVTRHPATARTIATKLARRFVSDQPPLAVVDRVARAYRDTDGHVRAMMRALVTAPEFWSEAAWNAKLKKPLELVASAARALDARPGSEIGRRSAGFHLARATSRLGEPLFYAQPPTGHPDTAEAWMNTGTLLARLNFAVALAHNRLPGVRVDLEGLLGDADRRRPEAVLDRLLAVTLHGQVSARTRETLIAQLHDAAGVRRTAGGQGAADTDVGNLAALVLGSPDFQRR